MYIIGLYATTVLAAGFGILFLIIIIIIIIVVIIVRKRWKILKTWICLADHFSSEQRILEKYGDIVNLYI